MDNFRAMMNFSRNLQGLRKSFLAPQVHGYTPSISSNLSQNLQRHLVTATVRTFKVSLLQARRLSTSPTNSNACVQYFKSSNDRSFSSVTGEHRPQEGGVLSTPEMYIDAQDPEIMDILSHDMMVKSDFVSETEEESLLGEVDKYMRRLRYEFDHWDNAIHGYRETEKKSWSENNSKILHRVRDLAFTSSLNPLAYVHVLDIAKEGYIKPHVDAVRFCGDTIAGICLLSSCVMRLALETDITKYADVLLPRRSLYIMKAKARYKFTHEVLKGTDSYFRGQHIPRDRRISVICRNEPDKASQD